MDQDFLNSLPKAPAWSLWAGQGGRLLILAGIAFFVFSVVSWLMAGGDRPQAAKLGKISFTLGAVSLFGALLCLGSLFVNDQFQYNYVFGHSDANIALKYKIAAIWAGQQGSFLLWASTSAIFGLLAVRTTGIYRRWFTIPYAAFLAALCGILAYETPFDITLVDGVALVPPMGTGLNPSLQNYWVVIHPPTIFMGFGSLTVMFCWAISAMMSRNVTLWVGMVRPWALLSLAILGLGLCMGGFWAYETLGWGGFWAWDPVENVSFVPWIFTAAFVHGLIVQTTRKRWPWTNLLMGGLPFLAFGYGTFLTRSGFYEKVSVHSFAEMQRSALWILLALVVASVLGFLSIWVTKGRSLAKAVDVPRQDAPGVNREGTYRLGVFILISIATATAIGMSVPLLMSIAGRDMKVVEEGLYHRVLVWFTVPLLIFMAVSPFASWRSMPLKEFLNRIFNIISLAAGFTGVALLIMRNPDWGVHLDPDARIGMPFGQSLPTLWWIAFLVFLALLTGIGNIWRLVELARRSAMSTGGFVAHIGVAVLLAGLFISRGFEHKEQIFVQKDEPGRAMGYTITYKGATTTDLYDRDRKLLFDVATPDGSSFEARPGAYYNRGSDDQNAVTWPHIEHHFSHDVYLALHSPVIFHWDKPLGFKQGETKTLEKVTVTYKGMEMQGSPGQQGTKFLAHVTVLTNGIAQDLTASLTMGSDGPAPDFVPIDKHLAIVLTSLSPVDKSAQLQVVYRSPVYPFEVFYKPMTILVWGGAGILTFGGLLSAFYRRSRKAVPAVEEEVPADTETAPATPLGSPA